MRLRVKILSGFLTLALMLLVAGAWSIYQLQYIGGSIQELLDDNYRSINAADVMLQALERQDSGVLLFLLGKLEEGKEILHSADAAFEEGYNTAKNNITIPGEKEYVENIGLRYGLYKSAWSRPVPEEDKEADLNWYSREMHQLFLKTKTSVEDLKKLNEKTLYETASKLKNYAHRTVMPGIVAIVSAFVFSLIFSYLVNHFLIGPIVKITRSVEDFARNREAFPIDIATKDEIGDLEAAISRLCAKVSLAEQRK